MYGKRLQSAMEYLMTYGWSILLIAVVLAAVFELGLFNNNALSNSNLCLAQQGYLCTNSKLNATGVLNVTVGQVTGGTITVTGVACTNSSGAPGSFSSITPVTLHNGQVNNLDFQCPTTSGTIGTPFSGSIWIQYTSGSGLTVQESKVGIVNVKITTTKPQGLTSYTTLLSIPITLTNSQSSSTGSNYQDMLNINSNQYSSSINSNWMNVEFTTGNAAAGSPGSALQAWVESNATNSASHTIVWVNLPSGIPATSSVTIYMDILAGSVMSASGPTGEAPQLSANYGQYDNGASVFSYYTNWAGNSLPTNWAQQTGGGQTYTVNNGITIQAQGVTNYGNIYYSAATFGANTMAEMYGYFSGSLAGSSYAVQRFGYGTGTIAYFAPFSAITAGDNEAKFGATSGGGDSGPVSTITYNSGTNTIYGVTYNGIATIAYENYVVQNSLSGAVAFPLNLGYGTESSSAVTMYSQWTRIRVAPPSGVAPSQGNGFVVPSQIIHYVPITITNSQSGAVIPGTQIMIPFTASTYQTYEASTMQNVEFFYSNGTVIPSWLEGNILNEQQTTSINTATDVVYWIKLGPSISASGGTQTIYAGFAPTGTNLFTGVTVGEGAQLSGTYGQYDNGASVFNVYQNFAGSSIPSGWSSVGSGFTSSFSNGVTLTPTPASGSTGWIGTTTNPVTVNTVTDAYTEFSGTPGASGNFCLNGPGGGPYGTAIGTSCSSHFGLWCFGGPGCIVNGTAMTYNNGVYLVYTTAYDGNKIYGSENYGSTVSETVGSGCPCAIELQQEKSTGTAFTTEWVRLRAFPPSGVLPSVGFGSFT